MSECGEKDWFVDWFNSPYYALLYHNRDDSEAKFLVQKLLQYFRLNPGSKVLDLACGRGRHSIEMYTAGMQVTGVDLSSESIREARKSEAPGLNFIVQDMRHLELGEKYDLVLNLFTSFGYFENTADNLRVLTGIHEVLDAKGRLVIDYLNCGKALKQMMGDFEMSVQTCSFHIRKEQSGRFIRKSIEVNDGVRQHRFEEKVQIFGLAEFTELLDRSGFRIMDTFGGYELQPFHPDESDRLIIVAQRL